MSAEVNGKVKVLWGDLVTVARKKYRFSNYFREERDMQGGVL